MQQDHLLWQIVMMAILFLFIGSSIAGEMDQVCPPSIKGQIRHVMTGLMLLNDHKGRIFDEPQPIRIWCEKSNGGKILKIKCAGCYYTQTSNQTAETFTKAHLILSSGSSGFIKTDASAVRKYTHDPNQVSVIFDYPVKIENLSNREAIACIIFACQQIFYITGNKCNF